MIDVARSGNKYLADTEPWKLIKENEARVKTIMNLSLQLAANLAIIAKPFLPVTAKKLEQMLNMKGAEWDKAGSLKLLEDNQQINKNELLFEKIDDEVVEAQVNKLIKSKELNEEADKRAAPLKQEIIFEDFAKVDIRVGEIKSAEKMPKSNKLLKLHVDLSEGYERTILSGIASYFTPEEVIGKQVCVVANLAPRKMMGIQSQGMILMAEDAEGNLQFVSPTGPVEPGSGVS